MAEKQGLKALSPEEKRLRAIEYSFWAGKLLDPKYFDQASKAYAVRDKNAFLKICEEAGIPQNVIQQALQDSTDNYVSGWGSGWGGGWGSGVSGW
jgi:hypothetical protein